jgi:hypothetical protein
MPAHKLLLCADGLSDMHGSSRTRAFVNRKLCCGSGALSLASGASVVSGVAAAVNILETNLVTPRAGLTVPGKAISFNSQPLLT